MDVRDKHNLPHHLKTEHTSPGQKKSLSRSLFSGHMVSRRKKITILFIVASLSCLVLNQRDASFMSLYREIIVDYFTPVLETLNKPKKWISALSNDYKKLLKAYEILEDLEEENEHLRYKAQELALLKAENKELHKILNTHHMEKTPLITARIVAKFSDAFTQNFLINLGTKDKIRTNQPVINQDGLLGRTISTSEDFSRVLPLTNPQSRIPSQIENADVDTLLVGDGNQYPYLKFIDKSRVNVGDIVHTSGKGGIYPAHIPIGKITSLTPDIRVAPFVDFNDLYYVRLIPPDVAAIPNEKGRL